MSSWAVLQLWRVPSWPGKTREKPTMLYENMTAVQLATEVHDAIRRGSFGMSSLALRHLCDKLDNEQRPSDRAADRIRSALTSAACFPFRPDTVDQKFTIRGIIAGL